MQDAFSRKQRCQRVCGGRFAPGTRDLNHELRKVIAQQLSDGLVMGDHRYLCMFQERVIRVEVDWSDNEIISSGEGSPDIHDTLSPVHVHEIYQIATGCKGFTELFPAVKCVQYQDVHKKIRDLKGLFGHS